MSFSPIPTYALGTMFIGLGIVSLTAPKIDYDLFGIPLEASPRSSTTTASEGVVSPIMYAKGVRDLATGLTYIALEYNGLSEAVTIFSAVLCVVAFGDGLIVWKHGGVQRRDKAFGHWGGLLPFSVWVAWRMRS